MVTEEIDILMITETKLDDSFPASQFFIQGFCTPFRLDRIMGDFNVDVKEVSLHLLCNQYKLKSLNKDPTCYKNIDNPSCIDLLLTNSAKSFESTCTIETGLSDFRKLVVTVLNEKQERMPPKVIQYRNYKKFDNAIFNNNLRKQIRFCDNKENIHGNFR